MKILITGASGNLGQSLVQLLSRTETDFLALTHRELDITDSHAVNTQILDYRPTIVINAAAYTQVEKAETEPALAHRINCDGAKHLATAAQRIDAAIFHISTDYIFTGDATIPYQESSPAEPHTIYGQSKLAGERAVALANSRHIILRTSWLFSEHGNNFLRTLLRLAQEKTSINVVNDQCGAPTYAKDLANTLLHLCQRYTLQEQLPWGIFHYSGAPYVSWYEFATAIFHQAAAQKLFATTPTINPIASGDYPAQVKRPLNSRLDCRKIHDAFGIAPSNWQAALRNLAAFL